MSAQTAKRRTISYATLQEIADDAVRLHAAGAPTTGNWSQGQIYEHVARLMDGSLDGFDFTAAWPLRKIAKFVIKPRIFKKGMPAGFQLKGDAGKALLPDPVADQAGLDHLLHAIQRLQNEPQRHPSPILEELTREEWDLLHRRHAELHMSFIAEPENLI
ncbi:DUF1569 domain-containing protein [Gimesia panareensis]|uniref:DUF1569 domain-containing protein n=1 Tax=Gimesia panareensis TaxID=2527978 RepID=UPI00118BD720|nr:DUF1569 domain-containing protein [Gimesia panareensis]QDU48418.1 hypothetical protein Pan110_07320 [Gimesia panareensis]